MATEEVSLTPAELEALGGKLDAANLSDKDRKILIAAFAAAAKAISDESDVSGFAMQGPGFLGGTSPVLRQGLSAGFQGSLSQGQLHNFNNSAIIFWYAARISARRG